MPARIIPSLRKVRGKTTVATNFALSLSRYAPTILVDLDTGTSSVRNTIDAPVSRDLYHFFKKGYKLSECVTTLPPNLDPAGEYKNFGFVAGPLHLIEEITNFDDRRKRQFQDAINHPRDVRDLTRSAGADAERDRLPALLELRDPRVHPSPPRLRSDIVKAILFKLRIVLAHEVCSRPQNDASDEGAHHPPLTAWRTCMTRRCRTLSLLPPTRRGARLHPISKPYRICRVLPACSTCSTSTGVTEIFDTKIAARDETRLERLQRSCSRTSAG
jgi:hypothetical protein